MKKLPFDSSKELKALFLEEFEQWKKRNRAGLEDLGAKCGVSGAYLGQIGRYGRVPSKSALILLALNFSMRNPKDLFEAAGIRDVWPYEPGTHLGEKSSLEPGFLSVRLDMQGLTDTMRDIVRTELKPRSFRDLIRTRPLRVGINPFKSWLFQSLQKNTEGQIEGYFTELCAMLGMSLQCRMEFTVVDYAMYPRKFAQNELDIFGPIVAAPNLPVGTLFTNPLYRIGMSALMRTKKISELDEVAIPKKPKDLSDSKYRIAVVETSRAHLLCNTRFQRQDNELILCKSTDEALERITLKATERPANIFMCNSVDAKIWKKKYGSDVEELFCEPESLLDFADCAVAVRADWPELVSTMNETISFLSSTGTLKEVFSRWVPKQMKGLIESM